MKKCMSEERDWTAHLKTKDGAEMHAKNWRVLRHALLWRYHSRQIKHPICFHKQLVYRQGTWALSRAKATCTAYGTYGITPHDCGFLLVAAALRCERFVHTASTHIVSLSPLWRSKQARPTPPRIDGTVNRPGHAVVYSSKNRPR